MDAKRTAQWGGRRLGAFVPNFVTSCRIPMKRKAEVFAVLNDPIHTYHERVVK